MLQDKPYIYGKHFGPHDIEGTDASTGKTWKETAKELGFEFQVVPKMAVEDRIHLAQLAFSHLWVDATKNIKWLDAIGQYHYVWDEKRGMFKDEPDHDWTSHFADEFSYASVVEEQMDNEAEKSFTNIEGNDGKDPYESSEPTSTGWI
jgi:phage terminase large subunit